MCRCGLGVESARAIWAVNWLPTGVFDAAEMHLVNEVASSISLALTRIAADRMPA